jgi:hypothetical protein
LFLLLFLLQEVEFFVKLVILILLIGVHRELVGFGLKALMLLRLFQPAQIGVNFDIPFHLVDDLLALVVHRLQLIELFGEVSRRLLEVLLLILVEILIIGCIVIIVFIVIILGGTFAVLYDVRR